MTYVRKLKIPHNILEGLAYGVVLRRLALDIFRIADGQKGIDPVFTSLRQGFPDLAGIEIQYPHIRKTHIRSGEHQVGKDYGRIGLRRVHTVRITDPGLFVSAADDEDYRGPVAGMDRMQAGQCLFTLDNPDTGRLQVLGRRGQRPASRIMFSLVSETGYLSKEWHE